MLVLVLVLVLVLYMSCMGVITGAIKIEGVKTEGDISISRSDFFRNAATETNGLSFLPSSSGGMLICTIIECHYMCIYIHVPK